MDEMQKAIINRGCKVRILISDPDNPIWSNQKIMNGLCPGTDIPGEIKDVLNRVQLAISELEQHSPPLRSGSLELRMYPCAPTNSIVIVDDEIARHTPYLPYSHSSQVPIYDVTRDRGGELFSSFRRTFDRAWVQSKPVLGVDFSKRHRRT
jgi:hypothetical protein